jgi:hypothetical protein
MGAEFYFDINGHPKVTKKKAITSSTDASTAVYSALCNTGGVITSLGRRVSREGVSNGVGVYGTAPDGATAQPYGEAFDNNPSSPTNWQGPFGKAFKRIDRPELTDPAACQAAAQAELDNAVSSVQPANFAMNPNFALDVGDLIKIGYPDDSLEIHIIKSLEQDLDSGSLSVSTLGRVVTN